MKNKKAQGTILFSIIVASLLFFVGMLAISFIENSITSARIANTCTNPATDGTKVLCLIFDGVIPYFFVTILSVVGGVITAKVMGV